jgi:hypothetical protein
MSHFIIDDVVIFGYGFDFDKVDSSIDIFETSSRRCVPIVILSDNSSNLTPS